MKIEDFPQDVRSRLIPEANGQLIYRCLGCQQEYGIDQLLYTCPECRHVLLLYDAAFDRLKETPGDTWRMIFDYRSMLNVPALKGIYRFHEFIGPVIPLTSIVCLGEGHTPLVEANARLKERVGLRFFFKNEGQNPSASFKDRGMASALSYIHFLVHSGQITDVLAVCASTGDTSAAAALYSAFLQPNIKSAVLLPHRKVTPQQLSQPLGSGARVFEIPGVFDDCMKVVENLAERYNVALLNSKNAWRILGQESYSYEIAQAFEYDLEKLVVVVPVGNAGNITAVMSGFIKFFEAGLILSLPKIIGIQSTHADPVVRFYAETDPVHRMFQPVIVQPSVAQAAMIGNPVSMPRVIQLEKTYNRLAKGKRVFFVSVDEQDIMDWHLIANRNGHIACTHGGESLAGLVAAKNTDIVTQDEIAVVASTAHALKFTGFQDMYFENNFPPEFEIQPDRGLMNAPVLIQPDSVKKFPAPGRPLADEEFKYFVDGVSREIADLLKLKGKE